MIARVMALVMIATLSGCANAELAYDHETRILWVGLKKTF